MLNIINRIGIVCYRVCNIAGTIIIILGVMVNLFSPATTTAVDIFYYLFAVVLFIIGFLVKYIFCGKIQ